MAKNKTEIHVTTVFDGELDATDVFVSLISGCFSLFSRQFMQIKSTSNQLFIDVYKRQFFI